MKLDIKEIILREGEQYPYSHRVEVSADAFVPIKIAKWLEENSIPHTQTAWNVFYMNKKNTEWLILRWS
jgi:hypothetical protein